MRLAVLTTWFRSKGNGEMWRREPAETLPIHTPTGYERARIAPALLARLQEFHAGHAERSVDESVPGYIHGEHGTPSELIELPRALKIAVSKDLRPVLEAWCGKSLESTAVYGVRVYRRGAVLNMHRDRTDTHVISATLCIGQSVDEAWPLHLEDNTYRPLRLEMQPGDMVLYEGARLLHGRPTPLVGDHYAGVFVHFRPGDDSRKSDDEIVV